MMTHLLIPRGCSRDYDDLFAREYLDVYAREVDGLGMYVPPQAARDFWVPDINSHRPQSRRLPVVVVRWEMRGCWIERCLKEKFVRDVYLSVVDRSMPIFSSICTWPVSQRTSRG